MPPFGHLLDHLVGDPADRVLADLRAVDLGEVRRDLTGRQPAGSQRQHDLVDPVQAALPLTHDHRVERAVPVPGDLDLHRTDLGQHSLRPGAVPRVLAVAADRSVLVIAEVIADLLLERRLEHGLRQPGEQPALTDELHPVLPRLRHEIFCQLLLINLSRHGLDRVGHDWSFPPSRPLGVSGQLHRNSDSPSRARAITAVVAVWPSAGGVAGAALRESSRDQPGTAAVDHGVGESPVVAGLTVGSFGGDLDAGEVQVGDVHAG